MRRAAPTALLVVCLSLLAACASTPEPVIRSSGEADAPAAGPRHRCYTIDQEATCEADPECESTWIREVNQEELSWQCAPR